MSTRIHTLTPLPHDTQYSPSPLFTSSAHITKHLPLVEGAAYPSSRSLNTGVAYSYCTQPIPKNQRGQCILFSVVFISHGENVSGLHFTLYRKKCKRNWRTLHGSVWLLPVLSTLNKQCIAGAGLHVHNWKGFVGPKKEDDRRPSSILFLYACLRYFTRTLP